MSDLGMGSSIAAGLRASRDELDFARNRVTGAVQLAPSHEPSGWSGPTAWAYQRALAVLNRDLDAAVTLLRSASDLTSAAIYQLGHDD